MKDKTKTKQSPQSQTQGYNPFRYTPISSQAGQATNTTDYIKQGFAKGLKPGTEEFSNYIANRPDFTEQEKADEGMRRGGKVKSGGSYRRAADGIASKGKTKGHVVKMASGGMAYSKGGKTGSSYRKAADGVATKGKTKGKQVKMMRGGYCG